MKRQSGVAGRNVSVVRQPEVKPERVRTRLTPGWLVVHAIDRGEREVAFWERHAAKLTQLERHAIAHGECGVLTRPLEPGWSEGSELRVGTNITITVGAWRFRRGRGDYRIPFTMRDFRAHYPRRVPPVHAYDRDHLDHLGMPPPPTPAEIKEASIEGATTTSKRMAVQGHDLAENVEAEDYRVLRMQARSRHAEFEEAEHAERVAEQQAKQLTRKLRKLQATAAKQGHDLTPRLAAMVGEAEAELAEKRAEAA